MTMRISQSSRLLQSLRHCLAQGESEIDQIQSPESVFEQNRARITAQLQKAAAVLSEPNNLETRASYTKMVVTCATELNTLEAEGLDNAKKNFQDEESAAKRELSKMLIKTLGPRLVRLSLESMSPDELGKYLPGSLRYDRGDSSTAAGSVQATAESDILDRGDSNVVPADSQCPNKPPISGDLGNKISGYETRGAKRRRTTSMDSRPAEQENGEIATTSLDEGQRNNAADSLGPENAAPDGVAPAQSESSEDTLVESVDRSELWPDSQGVCLTEQDKLKTLEMKALEVKRRAQGRGKQIVPFVHELSSFLQEKKNQDFARWSIEGDSFFVLNPSKFASAFMPDELGYDTYATFVQQLKKYDFHERGGLERVSMRTSDCVEKVQLEYCSPLFRREHPNLLWLIGDTEGGSPEISLEENETAGDGRNDRSGDLGDDRETQPLPCAEHSLMSHKDKEPAENEDLISLTDAERNHIGTIKKPTPWNTVVREILEIPIRRHTVQVRPRSRTFTSDNLTTLFNRGHSRSSRVLACMIQAGGEILNNQCTWCEQSRGPFEYCIVLGGKYAKCGNCEWTNHGCYTQSVSSGSELVDIGLGEEGDRCSSPQNCAIQKKHEWEVYRIKTSRATYPAWSHLNHQWLQWNESENCFEYLRQSESDGLRGFLKIPLKNVSKVRWNAGVWCVRFIMRERNPLSSNEDGLPPCEDVMVTFNQDAFVSQFIQFCEKKSVPVVHEMHTKSMVNDWKAMAPEAALFD